VVVRVGETVTDSRSVTGEDGSSEVILKPEECTLLGLWEETRWQVGDHAILASETKTQERAKVVAENGGGDKPQPDEMKEGQGSAPSPATSSSSASSSSKAKTAKGKNKKATAIVREWKNAFEFCGTITRTYTSVRVQWQDG
jgi:hypothetical protein